MGVEVGVAEVVVEGGKRGLGGVGVMPPVPVAAPLVRMWEEMGARRWMSVAAQRWGGAAVVGAFLPGAKEEGSDRRWLQVEAAQPGVEWMAQKEVGLRRAQPEVEERSPET